MTNQAPPEHRLHPGSKLSSKAEPSAQIEGSAQLARALKSTYMDLPMIVRKPFRVARLSLVRGPWNSSKSPLLRDNPIAERQSVPSSSALPF